MDNEQPLHIFKMRQTDRNIIMITAGGVGERFGSSVPKQYVEMNGRKVISYVIDACKRSQEADAILVVAHPTYHEELQAAYGIDIAGSGDVNLKGTVKHHTKDIAGSGKVVIEALAPVSTNN
jgi:2-C-methyl-D-erythritol 4-phosphate cytidylyltransferase